MSVRVRSHCLWYRITTVGRLLLVCRCSGRRIHVHRCAGYKFWTKSLFSHNQFVGKWLLPRWKPCRKRRRYFANARFVLLIKQMLWCTIFYVELRAWVSIKCLHFDIFICAHIFIQFNLALYSLWTLKYVVCHWVKHPQQILDDSSKNAVFNQCSKLLLHFTI